MMEFVQRLKKEVEAEIRRIESSNANSLKKALEASHALGDAFGQMKEFIMDYNFRDETEEIFFFKEVKPRLCSHLIYYRKVYNIEMNRPVGTIEVQQAYLHRELERIQEFQQKRQDFYRYLRSGTTNLDGIYFLRGKTDMELYLEAFYYERDPLFSTNCDFKVARIMANDMLQAFIICELEVLCAGQVKSDGVDLHNINLTWEMKKTYLIELLYALDTVGAFGKVALTRLAAFAEQLLRIELGNVTSNFSEMKTRNQPTPFLDMLKEGLLRRMKRKDKDNDKKQSK